MILGIPQGNQLFRHLNLSTDHLKQTGITEPFITVCFELPIATEKNHSHYRRRLNIHV